MHEDLAAQPHVAAPPQPLRTPAAALEPHARPPALRSRTQTPGVGSSTRRPGRHRLEWHPSKIDSRRSTHPAMCFPYHSRHPNRLLATRSPTLHIRFASRSLPCPGASAALPISPQRADHTATSCPTDEPSGPSPPRARARSPFLRRGSALSCDTRSSRPQHVAEVTHLANLRPCTLSIHRDSDRIRRDDLQGMSDVMRNDDARVGVVRVRRFVAVLVQHSMTIESISRHDTDHGLLFLRSSTSHRSTGEPGVVVPVEQQRPIIHPK